MMVEKSQPSGGRKLLLSSLIIGLLLVFFYLQHAAFDFSMVDIVLTMSSDSGGMHTFTGWTPVRRFDGREAVVSAGPESEVSILLPRPDDHILTMIVFPISTQAQELHIVVSVNNTEVGSLSPRPIGQWQALSLTIPAQVVRPGFNRIRFVHEEDGGSANVGSGYAVDLIGVRNFRGASLSVIKSTFHLDLPGPDIVLLFDNSSSLSHYWESWPDLRSISRSILLLLAFGFLWVLGATLLKFLAQLSYRRALHYALAAHAPGLLILTFFWLVSLLTSYHAYYPLGSFLFLSVGFSLVLCLAAVFAALLYRWGRRFATGRRMIRPSRFFISVFIVLMLVSALLSITGRGVFAQQTATWAYFALVMGVVLILLEKKRRKGV